MGEQNFLTMSWLFADGINGGYGSRQMRVASACAEFAQTEFEPLMKICSREEESGV
jgi:hypothetical protein